MKNLFYKTKLFQYKGLVKVLEISDRYSYEGYLVHHFIILGPMSLMSLTRNMFFNIGLILILIAGFSFLCKKIAEWIHTVENNFLKGVI